MEASSSLTRPPAVLIIDDEPSLLILLRAALQRAGYRVYSAANGVEGEHLALSHLPDLIVSDVMMPPPDGFELRQRLSKRPTTADIPFIFLTARTDPVEKRRALETGISDYITKPFDREEFIARIGAALRRRSWQLHSPLPSGGGRNER